MARTRGGARKATGGAAPRKTLSHPALLQFNRRHPLLRDQYVSDREVQTFPSTSDSQIQNVAETNNVSTQTDPEKLTIKIKRECNVANDMVTYLEDELRILRRKLQTAEAMQKKLESKPTSTCSNECCKKQ